MNLIIYFTIYFIITSLLGWFANRPDISFRNDKLLIRKNTRLAMLGFTGEEAYRCMYVLSQAIENSEKAILNLKTAMDKVCDEKQN